MRQLPLPTLDDVEVLDRIIAAKSPPRRGQLQAIRTAVLGAYANYAAVAPEVAGLTAIALTDIQRAALVHAYEVETVPLAQLRGALLGGAVTARCPFCAVSESSTLDHYLPKEAHPQFSILSKNLIPSCPTCNVHKRTLVVDGGTDVRLFLHPYFDVLPNARFVHLDVEVRPDVLSLSYRVVRPTGIAQATYRHVESHFRLLNLADRYRIMSLDEIRGQHHTLLRLYGEAEDAGRVGLGLTEEAETFEAAYGPNHWRAVLYAALADSDDFCDGGFKIILNIP